LSNGDLALVWSVTEVPLLARLGNALVAYCRYLGKLFWPANLSSFIRTPVPGPPRR